MEEVSVKIISNAECNKGYSDRITEAPTPAPTVTEAPGTEAPQTESPTTDSEDAYAPSTDSAEYTEPSSKPAQQSEPNATEVPTPASGEAVRGWMSFESGINSILDETTGDDDGLACVREIYQETLSRMDRVTAAKSIANRQERKNESTDVTGDGSEVVNWKPFSPPKSRQKTLSKPKLSRRPSLDSAPAGEMPRWKIIDGNEGPITDITVIFRGDSVPEGFTKLERSPSGQRADLNNGGRGSVISLCQSKDLSSVKAPISEICYFSRARRVRSN
ncbi:hypothetical protein PI124_g20916 [Phytophthora idaei]|nr:hypothetical protein PI124_g20916 [Phytophthora idaei]